MVFLDGIQLVLHVRGELDVHDARESLDELIRDHLAKQRGKEAAVGLLHISSILDGLDDRRVGTGPADSGGFESLYETGFGVAWWRLREVLFGVDLYGIDRLGFTKIGQQLVFAADPGHAHEAVEN